MLASSSHAGWVEMGQADEGTFYVDPAAILQAGSSRLVWELTDLKERDEGSELSRRSRVAYDCKHGLTRVLSLETYREPMATGKTILSVEREGLWTVTVQPPEMSFNWFMSNSKLCKKTKPSPS